MKHRKAKADPHRTPMLVSLPGLGDEIASTGRGRLWADGLRGAERGLSSDLESLVRDDAQRRRLEGAFLDAVEQVLRRIGQDIHDSLCQRLYTVAVACSSVQVKLAARLLPEAAEMDRIFGQVEASIADAHNLSRGLCLSHVSREGLAAALKRLASETTSECHVECTTKCVGDLEVESTAMARHLYRIAQEAVRNSVKHAQPMRIRIRLVVSAHGGHLSVTDDGIGIDGTSGSNFGLGLDMMRHRAEAIGGTLKIKRISSGGTLVSCHFAHSPAWPTHTQLNGGGS